MKIKFWIACFLVLNTYDAFSICIPTKIMPVGDSITYGVGEVLDNSLMVGYRKFLWDELVKNDYVVDFVGTLNSGDAFTTFDTNHEGRGGWTASQIASNIYQWLEANPADIILLHIGTNDIGFKDIQDIIVDVRDILDNIDMFEDAYNKPITVMLAQTINRQYHSLETTSFNNLLGDLVVNRKAAGDRIISADMENALVYPDDMYDFLHPNSSGYAKMADVWFSMLEEILVACEALDNQAPNGVIDSPSGDVTINQGESVVFAGSGSDPDGNLPLTYVWQFGAGSGVPNSNFEDPGAIRFDIPGTYQVTLTVTDGLGLVDSTPATRVVTVLSSSQPIPQAEWKLMYVDSQELVGENGAAVNAFDGNVNTFWHTAWLRGNPGPPHEIRIDLGGMYDIEGFRYLPRQDGGVNGRIGQYEFYVSADGVNWGVAAAAGTFANDKVQKEVTFARRAGRYVRLRALREVNGNPWASMAEINILGIASNVPQAPNGVIDSPSGDVTINRGDTVVFAGSGSDPDGNLPLTYVWQFGAGSGVPNSNSEDPGAIRFDIPGTYQVTLTVTDGLGLVDSTPATRVVTVLSSSQPIPQAGWKLMYVDSQELVGENGAAVNAFDGNVNTFWHTAWLRGNPGPPHEIRIDLGGMYDIEGFRYLPRQDGGVNGRIGQYEFYVSADGVNWGVAAAAGTFANDKVQKEVTFARRAGRYVRLRALREVNGNPWASMAEINILGIASNVPQAPNGVIDSPSGDVTINRGDTVVFAGSGSDPDGNLPLTYVWQFGAGSGVPNSNSEDPGAIRFDIPGTYQVTLTVTDGLGLVDSTPATRVVTVLSSSQPIPQAEWKLMYVDSQELVGENGAAVNAFDGNVNTFWHTAWLRGSPGPPHEIRIDLGGMYDIEGFRYLPRQDGGVNGRIGQYEFYVSADGVNWGVAAAAGTFANDKVQKEVAFAHRAGRYVRLRALSEVNGNPWASMSEINILGVPLSSYQTPDGVIDSPTGDVTINQGESVVFAGSGSDPDGNLPLTYVWQFGAGSGVPNSNSEDPGAIRFDIPGTYQVTLTVTDGLGLVDSTPAIRVVTVLSSSQPIPQAEWKLMYVDSEEPGSENGAAVNAFDGDVNTFWHTAWLSDSPGPPHEIQIDLGRMYDIDGFRYLPRQDGNVSGLIGQYEFYVSVDGVNWGLAAAVGAFANDKAQKEVIFAPRTGRYVRLRALSEANGNPWASMAEINILEKSTINVPIKAHPTNPQYFIDGSKTVYLTGAYAYNSLQDISGDELYLPNLISRSGFNAYLDFMVAQNHNFIRLWVLDQAWDQKNGVRISPHPWARTGPGIALDGLPKFDLTQFNPDFFSRLRERVIAARDRGIYVSVMLFGGMWGTEHAYTWVGHPFNKSNNISGINPDFNNDNLGLEVYTLQDTSVLTIQKALATKVIDTLNDLDNVIYEVANEVKNYSTQWQYEIIRHIKSEEAGKPKRHLVGMTGFDNIPHSDLTNSPADWISPSNSGGDYKYNPPQFSGEKIVITDTDHLWGEGGNPQWVWKSFMRGLHPIWLDRIKMDAGDLPQAVEIRKAMGQTLLLSNVLNMGRLKPRGDLSSTGYCLTDLDKQWVVYTVDSSPITVYFGSVRKEFRVEWIHSISGNKVYGANITTNGSYVFTPPFSDAVLNLIEVDG